MTKKTFLEIFKFVSVGGLVSLLHLALVYFLTSILGWWYILSTTISYTGAVVLNFFLQKFFVHQNSNHDHTTKQFVMFVALAFTCLGLNVLMMYVLVEVLHWHYLFSQAFVVVVLALTTFFIYRKFIFK